MGDTPLASLSLTHVHYVRLLFLFLLSLFFKVQPKLICCPESRGSPVLGVGVVGPVAPSTMCLLCDASVGLEGDGGCLDVCRPAGL
jgi:hypothetical protein